MISPFELNLIMTWAVGGYLMARFTFGDMTKEHYHEIGRLNLFIAHVLLGPFCWIIIILVYYKSVKFLVYRKLVFPKYLRQIEALYCEKVQSNIPEEVIVLQMKQSLDFYENITGKRLDAPNRRGGEYNAAYRNPEEPENELSFDKDEKGEAFFPPFNPAFLDRLGVDLPKLLQQLGIDLSAAHAWAKRCKADTFFQAQPAPQTLPERKALADTGNPFHQMMYAKRLLESSSEYASMRESFRYFMASAEQGLPNAQVSVGWCLLHGIGVERDILAAFEWNIKGALQGDPEGATNVGFHLEWGLGVPADKGKALLWYVYASSRGSNTGYGMLCDLLKQ